MFIYTILGLGAITASEPLNQGSRCKVPIKYLKIGLGVEAFEGMMYQALYPTNAAQPHWLT